MPSPQPRQRQSLTSSLPSRLSDTILHLTGTAVDCKPLSVTISSGRIIVDTDAPVSVYTIDGRLIFAGTAEGCAALAPAPGIYVVAVGDRAAKVTIR